jgi:hypothetical protein
MRTKRRFGFVVALATAGALSLAGIAVAAQTSTSSFAFTPSNVPANTFQAGQINLRTHTTYRPPDPTYPLRRIQFTFDNDFKFDPSVTPTCDPAQLGGDDLASAMSKCGPSLVGSGTAQVVTSVTARLCVLLFNGKRSNGLPTVVVFARARTTSPYSFSCANPSSNHGGNASFKLRGVLRASPLGGDYGKQLDINSISKFGFFVTDFNVTVKKGKYISARCHDPNHVWNLRTTFGYGTTSTSATQTVDSTQTCS